MPHNRPQGSRPPGNDAPSATKLADWKAQHPGAAVGSFADAGRFGDMLVLAVKGAAAALQAAGAFEGKMVIDATNPIAAKPPRLGRHAPSPWHPHRRRR